MSPQPRLSVVIPARNALRWLPGAIASIGSMAAMEVLVVDDGSEDGTADYLRGIAAGDRRIRPLSTARIGPAAARNAGLAVAQAPLVAFLDADDRWRRGKLAAQMELHRLFPEIGFSFTDHRRFSEDGAELAQGFARCGQFAARHVMRREGFVLEADAQAAIYAEPVVATSTVMARTALLRAVGGFNQQLDRSEDWDLWLHLAACAPVGCLPKPLTDRLVRAVAPEGPEGLARRAARRRVAEAYAPSVSLLDEEALRLCRTSQLALEADGAALAGRRVRAAMLRLSAFAQQPSRTMVRAAAWDLFGMRGRPAAEMASPRVAELPFRAP
ncbi:glycosyltransferase family 2 protein [Falsiroseomonas selenitidurans]|uniref:Glycosyltransferase family 2 protein n=1 Tax=Falsiroseomonas selenitidurans TaxID=2716335 RepID=A0ABX1DXA5_9PROT|nr:glycosyltransferase family A protein [Falsiroseomonas selenitidurans]NKC29523.1 glycosyltransferase family 2 protein [Falsiroseomonas selenitidurans]